MATYEAASGACRTHTFTIRTSDGRDLAADLVHPPGRAKSQVIVHGATATPRRHYLPFARFLATRGHRVLVYDYRGVGGSATDDHRRDPATMTEWLEQDAPAAVHALVDRDRDVPFFAIGHSFGGQIAAALGGVPAPRAPRRRASFARTRRPSARVVLRSNSVSALVEAVREGVGLGLVPTVLGTRDPRLVRLETPNPPQPRELFLTYHRDIEPSPRVRAVIAFLTDALGDRVVR